MWNWRERAPSRNQICKIETLLCFFRPISLQCIEMYLHSNIFSYICNNFLKLVSMMKEQYFYRIFIFLSNILSMQGRSGRFVLIALIGGGAQLHLDLVDIFSQIRNMIEFKPGPGNSDRRGKRTKQGSHLEIIDIVKTDWGLGILSKCFNITRLVGFICTGWFK